jgi:hypothetical protein
MIRITRTQKKKTIKWIRRIHNKLKIENGEKNLG